MTAGGPTLQESATFLTGIECTRSCPTCQAGQQCCSDEMKG